MPNDPIIETERLTIRRVRESDLPSLLAVNGDDEVTRYLPYPSWQSLADGKAWLNRMTVLMADGSAVQCVIVQRNSGQPIGTCLLFRIDAGCAKAELGYVLGRAFWGESYMSEAMTAFIEYAFNDFRLRRIEAVIDPRNIASARLLDRLGYVMEGLLRSNVCLKGEMLDSAIYGLLRNEWRGAGGETN